MSGRTKLDRANDAEVAFLVELTALTKRHGIKIAGCGCCGSPFLGELSDDERASPIGYVLNGAYADELCWITPVGDDYYWRKHHGEDN